MSTIDRDRDARLDPAFWILDLRDVNAGAPHARRTAALADLAHACATTGTFYVRGFDDEAGVIARTVAAFDAFFALPLEERMTIAVGPGESSGYEPLHRDSGEFNESFNCAGAPELVDASSCLPRPNDNKWPARPEGLRDATYAYLDAMHGIASSVFAAIAESLALPPDAFEEMLGPPIAGALRARVYPPQHLSRGNVGARPHVDGPPLALIVQNDVAGLASHVEGRGFVTLAPLPGTILCQLGSLFTRWTNGRYRPNLHRIVNDDPEHTRRSLVYWFPLRLDATIRCMVPLEPGATEPPPIRFDRYLMEWLSGLE